MVRKMLTIRITGKATGCELRAASPLSQDVFAKRCHTETTQQELLDYLNYQDYLLFIGQNFI